MEWRNVRQCAEADNGRGGSDDWGSSHMPGMSEIFFGRWTRRMPRSRWVSTHQISFLTWRVEFVARPGGGARPSLDGCVNHPFQTGQLRTRGSRAPPKVAHESLLGWLLSPGRGLA